MLVAMLCVLRSYSTGKSFTCLLQIHWKLKCFTVHDRRSAKPSNQFICIWAGRDIMMKKGKRKTCNLLSDKPRGESYFIDCSGEKCLHKHKKYRLMTFTKFIFNSLLWLLNIKKKLMNMRKINLQTINLPKIFFSFITHTLTKKRFTVPSIDVTPIALGNPF